MTLFAPDLFRNFAFGFVAGGLIIGASNVDLWTSMVDAPAHATAPIETPSAHADFALAPLETAR